jgi:hypothetical protein
MAKRREKIDIRPDTGYSLVAIVSSENDYRLSWLVNKHTAYNLARTEDLEIPSKVEGERFYHPSYAHQQEDEKQAMLTSNKPPGAAPLIKSQAKVDYLLVIYNDADGQKAKQAISGLKGKPGLIACFQIDPAGLKKQERDRLGSF